ncbi:UNKNOWN [Stylonychia lemnae]|uniref:Uncharacterized protein n=1 Tax=Stylonychia lemnae TaxID=5949 RepID=A0A078B862_STYLE|nr:UNKNOWN [Stylonychia lemnae]|eukprot:CDW89477.1 UNKNOWN [Stylonychia lemnae]
MGSQQGKGEIKGGHLPPETGSIKFQADPKQNQKSLAKLDSKKRAKSPIDSKPSSQGSQAALSQRVQPTLSSKIKSMKVQVPPEQSQLGQAEENQRKAMSMIVPNEGKPKAKKGVRIAGDDFEDQKQAPSNAPPNQSIKEMPKNQSALKASSNMKTSALQQELAAQTKQSNNIPPTKGQPVNKVEQAVTKNIQQKVQPVKKSPSRQNSKDKKQSVKSQASNLPKKRKMREVTDGKRQRYVQETSRVINLQTAKQMDLMLCVKEDQIAIAQHIIKSYQLIDVIDVRGFEEYITIKVSLDISGKLPDSRQKELEKTYNTKLWNPLNWAMYLQKSQYLSQFFQILPIHLTHSLDLNPGKFDLESNDEILYLNKGKMQSLCFCIYNKNWDDFYLVWTQSFRYLSGWYVFSALRAFVESEWDMGIQRFLLNEQTYKIIRAIPLKNRDELIHNMRQFSYLKARQINLLSVIEELIDQIVLRLDKDEKLSKHQTITTELFEIIKKDDVQQLEQIMLKHQITDISMYTGQHYKGQSDLTTYYKSPVDMLSQTIRPSQINPMILAIISNSQKCLELLTLRSEINLFYSTAKPGSYDHSDTCPLKNQIFPLTYTIVNEYFDMFQYFFEQMYSLWRAEQIKLIIDEIIESQNPTLIEYIFTHQRTHVLFNYLSYVDRQLLMGYLLISKDQSLLEVIEPHLKQKPYLGPYVFHIVANLEIIQDKFSEEMCDLINDEDIADYIEGVGSNQALYTVSELCISCPGGIENIPGLEVFIDRIENNYMYF